MKHLSVSKCGAHAVRWAIPCVTALSISACGGGDAPSVAGSSAGSADALAKTSLDSPAPVAASPAAAAAAAGVQISPAAPSGVAASAANATLFVASVLPGAQAASVGASRRREAPTSPAQWLDAEPPVGTASAPVMVVVAGALPQETATQATTRSGAARSAR